jgi:methylglutaconyl-CoA hydratase
LTAEELEAVAEGLTVQQEGALLRVHVDAGPGNLFTPAMTARLAALLRTPPEGVHVVHISAAGPDFCLGRAPFRAGAGPLRADVDGLIEVTEALRLCSAVTVVEVQGDAAGFGVGLVALADVAVAPAAVHLSFPEVDAGFAPALVLTWLVPLVGRRQAFWLAATGVRLPAPQAQALGLLTHVVESAAELPSAVAATIELLCSKKPAVHTDIKRMVRLYADLPEGRRAEVAADRLAFGALRRALAE